MFTVPIIQTSSANITRLFPGENIVIALEWFGYPTPTLYWIKDGITLMNNTGGLTYHITMNTSTLTVFDEGGQSGGRFIANASNIAGTATEEFIIECKKN